MANSITDLSLFKRSAVGFLAQFSPEFGKLLPCPTPLTFDQHRLNSERVNETLFVLLPGIQDHQFDFEHSGFVQAVRERSIKADLLAVDAHIGYYVRHTILKRLRQDVIEPARRDGYKKIWLVGTSLGGLGSALYAGQHELDLDGVVLLAPYLGQPSLIKKIDLAGGPQNWCPANITDFHSSHWTWLGKYFEHPDREPHLFLGFGERDRFAYANGYLADALPSDRVLKVSGGHDWETWSRLWSEFLERFTTMDKTQ